MRRRTVMVRRRRAVMVRRRTTVIQWRWTVMMMWRWTAVVRRRTVLVMRWRTAMMSRRRRTATSRRRRTAMMSRRRATSTTRRRTSTSRYTRVPILLPHVFARLFRLISARVTRIFVIVFLVASHRRHARAQRLHPSRQSFQHLPHAREPISRDAFERFDA